MLPWLAFGFALAAFALAALALFRGRAFAFAPEVLGGDVILPRSSAGGVKFLLPLQFSNAGYADGVIDWVALRLTVDGDAAKSVLLSPVAEVDMQRFLRAKRCLENDNTIEPFTSFVLQGKRALAKFVLFEPAERSRTAPLQLRPGRYAFELFYKAGAMREPRLGRSFEHVLEQKSIDEHLADATVYLINYQISLPGMRREVAGLEWLPRSRG